jgi:hypothetical protein
MQLLLMHVEIPGRSGRAIAARQAHEAPEQIAHRTFFIPHYGRAGSLREHTVSDSSYCTTTIMTVNPTPGPEMPPLVLPLDGGVCPYHYRLLRLEVRQP